MIVHPLTYLAFVGVGALLGACLLLLAANWELWFQRPKKRKAVYVVDLRNGRIRIEGLSA